MDGKNGELGKIQKKLQENQTPTESGPSAPSQQSPVAAEVTKRPTEGKPFLDEAAMKEMLAKAPDEKAFDQKIINDRVNEQLAVYYDSKSSDAQRATAKSKIDELYKLRDRQEEIKKALYGTNPAVNKVAPAKGAKRVTDNTPAESQPTIKSTNAVEKTVTSNLAPTPDTIVAPKLPGDMTEMAAIAKGKSLSDIGSIGVRNTTTAELGQTWKVKVDPKADMPEVAKPINPAEFQTSGTATGSFHGRFGGFAEPHPEGVTPSWSHYEKESDSKPAATSADKVSAEPKDSTEGTAVKATRKSQNAKAEEWKPPEYEKMRKEESETASPLTSKTGSKTKSSKTAEGKEKKLTKAEKEIEARTHSDSMLGPVIPGAEADTRTEEEKLQGDAWEKEFRGPGKSERSKDVEPPKTPEEVEYDKAWAEWKRNRDYFNGELTNSTGELKDRKFVGGIEHQFQEKYDEFLRNQGAWKFINAPRRFFGMRPLLPDGLKKLEAASSVAREQYFESAKRLKELKEKLPKGIQSEERTNFKDKQGRTPFERYQAMLARKLVIGVGSERLAIQQKVAMESEANSVLKKFKPTLETIQKHRYKFLALRVLGYGVIGAGAAASGGLLAASIAGGLMGSRILVGAGAGAVVGKGLHLLGSRKLNQLQGELENAQVDVQQNLFNKGFASSEAEVESLVRQIRETKASTKIASVGGAAIAGLVAGNLAGNIADSLTPFPHSPTDGSHPKWEGSTTNTPKYVYGQSVGEGGMVSGPPPAEAGSARLADIPDPKLDGVPPDLRGWGLPNEDSVPPASSAPDETPMPEPGPELSDAKMHTVVKGDNVWNIMEGKGPDANPIGGKSDVLKGMTQFEREDALNKLLAYSDQHPEFGRDIGALKSGGDLNRIYPGEPINVSMLDDKLRELLGMESTADNISPASTPETPNGTPLEEVEPHESIETDVPGPDEFPEHGPVTVRGEVGTFVVEGRTADVNLMTIRDAMNLAQGVRVDDPNALALLEEMSIDKDSFSDIIDFMWTHGSGQTNDPSMTVGEYVNNYKGMPYNLPAEAAPAANDNIPDVTPYGFDQPTANPDTVVREASVSGTEAVGGQSFENYVRSVEQPKNGFLENLIGLGKPNVAGTFDQMANLTIGDIKAMDVNGELPEGVSGAGFDVWAKEVAGAAANDNNKTLVEYVSGLANSRVA